ncbi:MAG: UbiX family flavin prenyltransferase [Thermoplasmata archaeon]|nr:UbiX family flavin prenyltransferase [Thermoplasmata archaeon]
MAERRIIVGVTGASGQALALETLRALREAGVATHLVASEVAIELMEHETGVQRDGLEAMADIVHDDADLFAPISSGSFRTMGMIVVPCSMATLAEIANGISKTLLVRAADVCLKERRKLVLVARETPLSLVHIENMARATRAGAVVLPPVITTYSRPETLEDMVRHIVGKALDQFDVEHRLYRRWE